MSQIVENLVTLIQKVTGYVRTIDDTYAAMPALIDLEHQAISNHDLDSIEEIAAKKLTHSTFLEEQYSLLKESCQKIRDLAENAGVDTTLPPDAKLSATFKIISNLIESLGDRGEKVASAHEALQSLESTFNGFLSTSDSAKKHVEVNRMVLSRILAQRQENYRFWQEVSADIMASYNRGGKQKSSRPHSMLNIKA